MNPGPAPQFDRQEVLRKAMELFWEQGYEETGMTQLLEHVGIGRQSLYNTFGGKHDLFLEALEAYDHGFLQTMVEVLEAPGSPLGNLRRVFGLWESMVSSGEFRGCLYASASASLGRHDREVAKVLENSYKRIEGAFARTLERAKEQGELRPEIDAEDLARLLVNTGQGLAVLSSVRGVEHARGVLRSVDALLEGV